MASTVILCLVLSFIGSSPVLAQAPQKKPFQQEPGRFRGWGLLRWWPWRGREPEPGGLQWWGDGARGNEREAQPPIIIEPTAGEAVASIIWLHGMGDNGKGWATLLTKKVDHQLPQAGRVRYIFPNAPIIKITYNGGHKMPSWYDIASVNGAGRFSEDARALSVSAANIELLIQDELEKGIPIERILLGGFSQGASMVLHTALRSEHRLPGAILLAGWLPLAEEYPRELSEHAKTDLRLYWVHGEEDPIVKHKWGHNSHTQLTESGVHSQFVSAPGLDHRADDFLLSQAAAFMSELLCAGGASAGEPEGAAEPLDSGADQRRLQEASPDLWQSLYKVSEVAPAVPAAPAAGGCALWSGEVNERWWREWAKRIDEWWLAIPYSDGLRGCIGALGLHLSERLDSAWRGARTGTQGSRPPATAADARCSAVLESVEKGSLQLPEFPTFPNSFQLPPVVPIPRLLRAPPVEWSMRQEVLGHQQEEQPMAEQSDESSVLLVGAASGAAAFAATFAAGIAVLHWRRKPGGRVTLRVVRSS